MIDRGSLHSHRIRLVACGNDVAFWDDGRLVKGGEKVAAADLLFSFIPVDLRHELGIILRKRRARIGQLSIRSVRQRYPLIGEELGYRAKAAHRYLITGERSLCHGIDNLCVDRREVAGALFLGRDKGDLAFCRATNARTLIGAKVK